MDLGELVSDLIPFAVLVVVALAASGFAVWFGQRVVAPRIGRALDRAQTEDEPHEDRDDRDD